MAKQAKPLVLITGSNGNIGAALSKSLSSDYHVIGLDRDAPADVVADLTSDESMASAFKKLRKQHGNKIAAVIHLAAYFDFSGDKSPLYDEVNVRGSERLLNALRDFEVERFIYSGTMLVHEPCSPGESINELTPLQPGWAYPQSKADTEATIREHRGDIPCTFLHLAGLYDEGSAVPTLAHQIAWIYERHPKSHLYAGDTEAGQSFIHLDDMIDLFKRCVDRRKKLPDDCVILAGEPDVMSYSELQDRLGKLIHGEDKWTTINLPQPLAKAGAWLQEKSEPVVPDAIDHGEKPFVRPFLIDLAADHFALDISKAHELLGWKPKHSINKSLPAMIKNLQKDPIEWYKRNGMRPPDVLVIADDQVDDPNKLLKQHEKWYRDEHARNLWGSMVNVFLGCWLLFSVPRLGYDSEAMVISDMVSGAAIIVLSLLSLSWRVPVARWVTALVGLWVMSAPLVFWSTSPAAYLNGCIVGTLVAGFAVALRPAPGVSPVAVMTGPTVPPGWEYSPSTWSQRLPIIILALIGFFISAYMAAYQLGHIDTIWDPFFSGAIEGDGKNGTGEIITSSISEAWPVPDAGAGAMVYLLEILVGLIGSSKRWRTMPWLTILFGILIVPLGAVSITFIIIQPILLDTWCTLCLMAAAAMLLQIPFSLDEIIATCQFLARRKRQGHSLLRTFIFGDTDDMPDKKKDAYEEEHFERPPLQILRMLFTGGVRWCTGLWICVALGVVLMFTRLLLGAEGAMADTHHLIGSLMITVSISALAEVGRPLRFLNMIMAMALAICAFVLEGTLTTQLFTLAMAVAIIVASIPRGPVNSQYGDWTPLIR